MPEAVVLGDLELDLVTGLIIDEARKLAIHRWPGGDGDILQDMGMSAARIRLTGVALGSDAGGRLEQLRGVMQKGAPCDFAASAAVAANIEQVMIAALRVSQPPGRLDYYEYQLDLVRYVPPPPPPAAGFDLGALADIGGAVDLSALSAVADAASALGEAGAALETLNDALAAAKSVVDKVEAAIEAVQGLGSIAELLGKAGAVVKAWAG